MATSDSSKSAPGSSGGIVGRPKQCIRNSGESSRADKPGDQNTKVEGRAESMPPTHGLRPGDSGVGRPVQKAVSSKPVEGTPRPQVEDQNPVNAPDLIKRPKIWVKRLEIWAPGIFRTPIVYFSALLILSLLITWIILSVLSVAADLAALPTWLAGTVAFLLAVLAGIVVVIMLLVTLRYFKAVFRPQLVLRQIEASRVAEYGAYDKARDELKDYLGSLNRNDGQYQTVLERSGLTEAQTKKFTADVSELLRDRAIDGKAWLNEYRDNVQAVLDDLAARKQRKYATIVGLKTAVSPWKTVDLLAVAYNNFRLIQELCELANRRADGLQSLSLLVHVGFNMFVASEAQELAAQAAGKAIEGYDEIAAAIAGDSILGSEAAAEGAKGVASEGLKSTSKYISAKLGEGIANAWLTQRFGKRVWKLLTPLTD